jgi:hypothetical protein
MQEQGWTQLKMELIDKKVDWEAAKEKNEAMIIGNLMQIEMAKKIIELCNEKIKEFEDKENAI